MDNILVLYRYTERHWWSHLQWLEMDTLVMAARVTIFILIKIHFKPLTAIHRCIDILFVLLRQIIIDIFIAIVAVFVTHVLSQ